jgi:hypothetical protein
MSVHEQVGKQFETLDKYLQKAVGRDMMLKSIVYPIRLLNYHTDPNVGDRAKILQQLITNIIDARMLSNAWKGIGAYLSGYRTAMSSEAMPWYQRLLLSLSFFFRMAEQFSGDLGYTQKYIMTHWNRVRISWHYKFWKTMSLTCSAILETIKIVNIQSKRRQLRRYVAQSPLTASPSAQPTVFPANTTSEEDQDLAAAMRWSSLFLLRNIADMIVYYQWIESYNPNKNIEYSCGFFSGAVGVWLVWRDSKSATKNNIKV